MLNLWTVASAAPRNVRRRIIEDLRSKTWLIESRRYWIHKANIRKWRWGKSEIQGAATEQRSAEQKRKATPRYITSTWRYPVLLRQKRPFVTEIVAQVVHQVASVPSTNDYESDCSFEDRGFYRRICCSINHVTLEYDHLKKDTHFMIASSRSYSARTGSNGDHRGQMRYPVSRFSQSLPENPAQQGGFNSDNDKWRNKLYLPCHDLWTNSSYSSTPTDRSTNVAP